ncbi:hypothetical protein M427DRAFT_494831 [Gonapodya prolifera JEL478]|uniref:Uncharacterized protein n=1 Tax=Gonapodya prolifera (strain JEL478) TaxID=1344416 RepID=A0A139AJS8_GONPJ|nr:hypothetical protein M427DRAFT_494831 [Gonapodya prolifera JEL478]|eukprot:KXS16655.1 hypothetical protein M427DRAFT_494831 [Gonapodya prolifera JEL478]
MPSALIANSLRGTFYKPRLVTAAPKFSELLPLSDFPKYKHDAAGNPSSKTFAEDKHAQKEDSDAVLEDEDTGLDEPHPPASTTAPLPPRGADIAQQMGAHTRYNERKNLPPGFRAIDDGEEEGERATDPKREE